MQEITITQITPPELETLIENTIKKVLSIHQTPPYPQADEVLTIKQAAQLLCLSVPTIYGLVHRSEIPVSKRGKRLYFSKVELTQWIKDGRKKTTKEIATEAEHYLKSKK